MGTHREGGEGVQGDRPASGAGDDGRRAHRGAGGQVGRHVQAGRRRDGLDRQVRQRVQQDLVPLRVVRGRLPDVPGEQAVVDEARERGLHVHGSVAVGELARREQRVTQRRGRDQVPDAQARQQRLREGADVDHAAVAVEGLQGLQRTTGAAELAVLVVLDHRRAVRRGVRQEGPAPGQPQRHPEGELVRRGGVDQLPGAERAALLVEVVPESLRVPRIVTDSVDDARAFLDDALKRGHEGVVVKALEVAYEAGRRGTGWVKVKPRHTLDLVVLAVEWGHGRRRGWLSNLHLGARDPETGEWVMLGKTFKGLTDAMLKWQTDELLRLETSRNDWQVFVRPELVVEVAFDGVQTSPRYPGGMALRFARVLRYRPDKRAEDADTVDTVRAIHAG